MISTDLARLLAASGLRWKPSNGDAFRIDGDDFDDEVFTLSDMTIEAHEFGAGTVLGFNGTTEWALDSLSLDDVLWMPREDQLRTMLGSTFHSLARVEELFRVEATIGKTLERFEAEDPAEAYGRALLALVTLASR